MRPICAYRGFVSHKSDDTKSDIVVKGVHPFEEREREREKLQTVKHHQIPRFKGVWYSINVSFKSFPSKKKKNENHNIQSNHVEHQSHIWYSH